MEMLIRVVAHLEGCKDRRRRSSRKVQPVCAPASRSEANQCEDGPIPRGLPPTSYLRLSSPTINIGPRTACWDNEIRISISNVRRKERRQAASRWLTQRGPGSPFGPPSLQLKSYSLVTNRFLANQCVATERLDRFLPAPHSQQSATFEPPLRVGKEDMLWVMMFFTRIVQMSADQSS